MTDTPEEKAAFEDELKRELIDKLAAQGVKADMRYSVAKLEEMLGNLGLEVKIEEAGPAPDDIPPAPPPVAETPAPTVVPPEAVNVAPAPPVAPTSTSQPLPPGWVWVRITKRGAGKVHTGIADPARYEMDDMVAMPRASALALEAKAYAEIRD